jgi:hypothetical protein
LRFRIEKGEVLVDSRGLRKFSAAMMRAQFCLGA